jgi:hypothetical protein
MRLLLALSLALTAAALLPGIASAAKPSPPWPTARDIAAQTPGIHADDAACMAGYYHGRLSGTGWRTTWSALTRAQKIVTDNGMQRCTTKAERIVIYRTAFRGLVLTESLDCLARVSVEQPLAERLAIDTHAKATADLDRTTARCGAIGRLFGIFAKGMHLNLDAQATECTNRTGSMQPFLHGKLSRAARVAVARVLDRCVERTATADMWRFIYTSSKDVPRERISCLVYYMSGHVTLVDMAATSPVLKRQAGLAVDSCIKAAALVA